MTIKHLSNQNHQERLTHKQSSSEKEGDKILCPHCRRTANNGIKCKGICVADSDY